MSEKITKNKDINSNKSDKSDYNYNDREERVIFILSKITILVISFISIYLTGTHGKNLFVCGFIYMLPILSDYLTLFRTTKKTEKSYKVSLRLFISCIFFTLIFVIGVFANIEIANGGQSISFFKTNGELIFTLSNMIVEATLYIIMILTSSFYLFEIIGVTNRKMILSEMETV